MTYKLWCNDKRVLITIRKYGLIIILILHFHLHQYFKNVCGVLAVCFCFSIRESSLVDLSCYPNSSFLQYLQIH